MKNIKQCLLLGALSGSFFIASAAFAAEPLPAPIKFLESEGVQIVGEFEAPGGLKGYAARFRGDTMGIYLTPDEKHAIVGTLINEKGDPAAQAEIQRLVDAAPSLIDWEALGKSSWVVEGDKNAKRIVYAFMDPNCPYCAVFWEKARPYLKQKGVQLRHIMVGVLGPTSLPISAKILTAKDPAKALADHELALLQRKEGLSAEGKVPEKAQQDVIANSQLMHSSQIFGTPAVIYQDKEGKVKVAQGVPNDQLMKEIFSVTP